eukprot:1181666-Prorocentrum_minimum.AAC.1
MDNQHFDSLFHPSGARLPQYQLFLFHTATGFPNRMVSLEFTFKSKNQVIICAGYHPELAPEYTLTGCPACGRSGVK